MAKSKRTYEEQTSDPAAQQMLIRADELGIGTPSAAPMIWCPAISAGPGCAARCAAWAPAA